MSSAWRWVWKKDEVQAVPPRKKNKWGEGEDDDEQKGNLEEFGEGPGTCTGTSDSARGSVGMVGNGNGTRPKYGKVS